MLLGGPCYLYTFECLSLTDLARLACTNRQHQIIGREIGIVRGHLPPGPLVRMGPIGRMLMKRSVADSELFTWQRALSTPWHVDDLNHLNRIAGGHFWCSNSMLDYASSGLASAVQRRSTDTHSGTIETIDWLIARIDGLKTDYSLDDKSIKTKRNKIYANLVVAVTVSVSPTLHSLSP